MKVAGEVAEGMLDQATLTLRELLKQAADDETQRGTALARVLRADVLAATWPGAREALRTLTNGDGEQAMPLFSGADQLRIAAGRFGWMSPDGSLGTRTLSAREALAGALSQGVHFVVLDICADYALEFSREDIAKALLTAPTAHEPSSARPEAARAPRGQSSRPLATAQPTAHVSRGPKPRAASGSLGRASLHAPKLAEIDRPFQERPTAQSVRPLPAVEEPATPRPRASMRPDPRVEPNLPPEPPLGRASRASRRPQAIPKAKPATPRPRIQSPRPSQPPHREGKPALRTWSDSPPPRPHSVALTPEVPAEAPTAAEVVQPLLKRGAPSAAPAAPVKVMQLVKVAADEAAARAMAEQPATATGLPSLDSVAESLPEPAPVAPVAAVVAAVPVAHASPNAAPHDDAATRAKSPQKPSARRKERPSAAAQPAAAVAHAIAKTGDAELPPGALRPPAVLLDDAVLKAVAEALRKYPEVEWACELSDGSAMPLMGVRVEPSFMKRVSEISAAIRAAGESQGTALAVLMLVESAQMREGRARGNVFYPWRKAAQKH